MLIRLDFSSDVPIYLQIRNQVVLGIADRRLSPGDKLPTIRSMADQSGINMMTVNKAYQLLKQEGYIQTDRRSGAVISGEPPSGQFPGQYLDSLRLLVSEAKLHGIDKQAFLIECTRLFDGMEVSK